MSLRDPSRPFVRSAAVARTPLARLVGAGSRLAGALINQPAPVAAEADQLAGWRGHRPINWRICNQLARRMLGPFRM
jgi:hypothetical protein